MPDSTPIDAIGTLQHRVQQLERLLDISAQLNSTLDFPQLLRSILQSACELLDAEASSIFLTDRETGDLVMALATNLPVEVARTIRVKPGQGIAGKVVASGETVLVSDVSADPAFYGQVDTLTSFTTRSILCIPLRTHEVTFDEGGGQVLESRVIGVTQVLNKRNGTFTVEDIELFKAMAAQAAVALETTRLYEEMQGTFMGVVRAMAAAIDAKDDYTHGHSARVAEFSTCIGRHMGLTRRQLATLRLSALLHDVGKIGIPDNVLNKRDRLTDDEFAIIQRHPEIGFNIMGQVPAFQDALRGMHEHHERLDGRGYPNHMTSEQISLFARIIGVADAFDAMTSSRVYRAAMPTDEALRRMQSGAGTQFDPDAVQALIASCNNGLIIPAGDATAR